MAATPGVGATYKAREVEETLDVWFYRPIGYQIARVAWRLGHTPNAVTALGGLLGILAGHLFLYRGWVPAAWAIALLVTSEKGYLTDVGLKRLREYLSEVPAGRFRSPMSVGDIPRLFTPETFCKIVARRLRAAPKADA
jgi:hypothetical protein